MTTDAVTNFAFSTVLAAPSPALSGTSLVVASGDGAGFPAAPGNYVVWPPNVQPSRANAEIVRVTVISTDTLTITRAQEGTPAKSIAAGWQIARAMTAYDWTEVQKASNLTGTTLAANVVSSSLTGVGVLAAPHMTSPVIDSGSLTGNVIGNAATATSAGTATLASAATVLATPRAINGVNFDGSAPITVTAAAGTLTGTTLAANVVNSSLTSISNAGGSVNTNANGSISLTPLAGQSTTVTNGGLNVVGNSTITGTLGSITTLTATTVVAALTGNSSTATALQTPRTINGVSFDGTANINSTPITTTGDIIYSSAGTTLARLPIGSTTFVLTVVGGVPAWAASAGGAAPAGTLTGTVLASNVVTSSLTSVGILAAPHMTSPVIDSGGLVVTAGGITVSAGAMSVTGNGGSYIGVAVAGGATLRTLTPGAHTAVVAEVIDSDFDAHTMTITGGYSVQRFTLFRAPTITAGSALTVADAATVTISGAPIPAGSALITRPWSLWVQAGQTQLVGPTNTVAPSGAWKPALVIQSGASSSYSGIQFGHSGTNTDGAIAGFSGNLIVGAIGGSGQVLINYNTGATGGLNIYSGTTTSTYSFATSLMTFGDAINIAVGTTTGTKIGTATTQKIGIYNAPPIAQRSGAAQALVVTTASTQTTPWGYATQAQADGVITLLNEMRNWAVAQGWIAGA